MTEPFTPEDLALLADRIRPSLAPVLPPERLATVSAVLNSVNSVIHVLRSAELGEASPAFDTTNQE